MTLQASNNNNNMRQGAVLSWLVETRDKRVRVTELDEVFNIIPGFLDSVEFVFGSDWWRTIVIIQ